MDNSLDALCDAVKKILARLKPQTHPLSFIIVTGKNAQGKSALLRQGRMEETVVISESHARVYSNSNGILIELGETWFAQSKSLLQNTLKQLNKCSARLKITGLILCVDVNDLLLAEPAEFIAQKKSHIHTLERIGLNLGYPLDVAIVLTKMDTLAGFCEYYHTDHATELAKPLGFSLNCVNTMSLKIAAYKHHFSQCIEMVGQDTIHKMHPARSTIKRSLIREFPLQLASLQAPLQLLLQGISTKLFNVHSIYFTSAEQGGVSIDRLNKKIRHEYALVVQDTFPQAVNYRAYFIEGALTTVQEQCKQSVHRKKIPQKPLMALTLSLALCGLCFLGYKHLKSTELLDDASKELLTYRTLDHQGDAQALYHLSKASKAIAHIHTNALSLPYVHALKSKLDNQTNARMQSEFLPALGHTLETVIAQPNNTPLMRYKALKVYLMLGQPEYFSASMVFDWFKEQWGAQGVVSRKQLSVLHEVLTSPHHTVAIKQQVITDARNYLNALPTSYFYYALAKDYFTKEEEKIAINGFNLATNQLPVYFTKRGFQKTLQAMPAIVQRLQAENWVLARQDLQQLHGMLVAAYAYNYVSWWRTFLKTSQPMRYQDYAAGRLLAKTLHQANAITQVIQLVQEQTRLDSVDNASSFNQLVASQFTDLHLISLSLVRDVNGKIAELEQFLATLAMIKDEGKTAFSITKSRFANSNAADPLGTLFTAAGQFPDPVKTWLNQLAGDTWFMLIKDTRTYINKQWQQTVYAEFKHNIAQRYPFFASESNEISLADFTRFFSTHGVLNTFSEGYLKPFLDLSNAEWKPKVVNEGVLPLSTETLDAIMRANIITNMFYPDHLDTLNIHFSLQKISLDPVVSNLRLQIGSTRLTDNQGSDSAIAFTWPQNDAKLALNSIEGQHYEISELGVWALFKLLEKVNVLVDEQDSASLQILFEINGNSGRYLLKTDNKVNPFTPGILNGFSLQEVIV